MIISASRRTDIPAYYSEWLEGRFDAGYCLVRNPFDARRSTRVSLAPEDVDFLVLWTRDPRPIFPLIARLDARGIRSYVQMTVNAYPAGVEPGAPDLEISIGAFSELSRLIGKRRVLWRYDPIFLADGVDADFHRRVFETMASAFEGITERVSLSLLDEYAGTASRLARAGYPRPLFGSAKNPPAKSTGATSSAAADSLILGGGRLPTEPYTRLLSDLAAIARSRGIVPQACAEPYDLGFAGIEPGACIDPSLAASLWGEPAGARGADRRKDKGQRADCRCAPSVDIGAYGTCPRGCVYCYANRGAAKGGAAARARGRDDEYL